MNYYEVVPNRIVHASGDTLTYASELTLEPGAIVEIPIAKRNFPGVVITKTIKPDYATREIIRQIYDDSLPKPLIKLALWVSEYYVSPLPNVLRTLLPSGIAKTRRGSFKKPQIVKYNRTNYVFNALQTAAINTINSSASRTFLLHGVTGSGKTRVYLETARHAIENGKSVIVLVPEIALTSQLVAEFRQEFDDILVTHSHQTEAERHLTWQQALTASSPTIVIGPRSALFLPLKNIGLIVIDECHEPSYKQEQSPRYSALLVAKQLASAHRANLILGSATPLVSDYYLATQHPGSIIELPERANPDVVAPETLLVDMTKRDNFRSHRFFSDALLAAIKKALEAHEQVLIFHNRRGSSSVTLCEKCGWQAGCPRCFIPLTLHADQHKLICHICNFTSNVPTSCPTCGSIDIIHKGIGTKLIEDELKRLYPDKRVVRFDGDNDRDSTVNKLYRELHDGTIDIIIGTQVIAKGLNLPNLALVGVVQGDSGLSLPDYTAAERAFQLLSQVVGRVGRNAKSTKVIVQSYQPDHIAIKDGVAQNYADFYERTIALRKHAGFPPFNFLLKLTCSYKTEAVAIKNSKQLAITIRSGHPDVEVLGPTPAFYERTRDSYRWQVVVRSRKREQLLAIAKQLPEKGWQFELDPIGLL